MDIQYKNPHKVCFCLKPCNFLSTLLVICVPEGWGWNKQRPLSLRGFFWVVRRLLRLFPLMTDSAADSYKWINVISWCYGRKQKRCVGQRGSWFAALRARSPCLMSIHANTFPPCTITERKRTACVQKNPVTPAAAAFICTTISLLIQRNLHFHTTSTCSEIPVAPSLQAV